MLQAGSGVVDLSSGLGSLTKPELERKSPKRASGFGVSGFRFTGLGFRGLEVQGLGNKVTSH